MAAKESAEAGIFVAIGVRVHSRRQILVKHFRCMSSPAIIALRDRDSGYHIISLTWWLLNQGGTSLHGFDIGPAARTQFIDAEPFSMVEEPRGGRVPGVAAFCSATFQGEMDRPGNEPPFGGIRAAVETVQQLTPSGGLDNMLFDGLARPSRGGADTYQKLIRASRRPPLVFLPSIISALIMSGGRSHASLHHCHRERYQPHP